MSKVVLVPTVEFDLTNTAPHGVLLEEEELDVLDELELLELLEMLDEDELVLELELLDEDKLLLELLLELLDEDELLGSSNPDSRAIHPVSPVTSEYILKPVVVTLVAPVPLAGSVVL